MTINVFSYLKIIITHLHFHSVWHSSTRTINLLHGAHFSMHSDGFLTHFKSALQLFFRHLSPLHNDCSKLSLYAFTGQGLCILRACLLTYKTRLQFYNPFPPEWSCNGKNSVTRRNQRNTSSNGVFPSDDFIVTANSNPLYIRSFFFFF